MDRKYLAISLLAVALSFVGGFLFANAINRGELSALRGENERLKSASGGRTGSEADADLTADEIRAKIGEAAANPDNIPFQRSLGIALYRYAAMKQEPSLLAEAVTILHRAYAKEPNDLDVAITLGNAYFDIGYFEKSNRELAEARKYYEQVLRARPDNVEIRTDRGLTFYLQDPPEMDAAIADFELSLKRDPGHEKTLQFMIQAHWRSGRQEKAADYLEQLKKTKPNSRSIGELSTLLTRSPEAQ